MKYIVMLTENQNELSFFITFNEFKELYQYHKKNVLKEAILELLFYIPAGVMNELELKNIKNKLTNYENFSQFSHIAVSLNNNVQYAFEKLNKTLVDDSDFYNISAKEFNNEVKLAGRIVFNENKFIICVNGLYAEYFNEKIPYYVYYGGNIAHTHFSNRRAKKQVRLLSNYQEV